MDIMMSDIDHFIITIISNTAQQLMGTKGCKKKKEVQQHVSPSLHIPLVECFIGHILKFYQLKF